VQDLLVRARGAAGDRCGPRVPPSFSCSAAPSWRWLDWSRG